MTPSVQALLARGVAALASTSDSPRADAMLLLAHALECERGWIVAHGEARVARGPAKRFGALFNLRATGVPLAYVLGSAGFYGREFAVDARVLVPRPETEHLIDEAAAFLNERSGSGGRPATVLDVGTGSGAIACTIAAENRHTLVDGTDVSPAAIAVARGNAQKLNVDGRCRFHCGQFAAPVAGRRFDVVLANLPYLPTSEIPLPPNPVAFEPREAVDGGVDGLDAYREFVPVASPLLEPGGLVLLEAAPAQMPGLVDLVERTFGAAAVEVGSDFAGLARYVKVTTGKR
jgi:release factor glutamine methyltransferase